MTATEQQVATRRRDAERTRRNILDVATAEFAAGGYAGARVDEIASRTSTTKRMIYYYFGSKEGLFEAVLERAYGAIRAMEKRLKLADHPPLAAIERYVRNTVVYHYDHPELGKLVAVENLQGAAHLKERERHLAMNATVVDLVDDVLRRGRASGDFRADGPSALDVHLIVTALAIFRSTNVATIQAIFDYDLGSEDIVDRWIEEVTEMVVRWLATGTRDGD